MLVDVLNVDVVKLFEKMEDIGVTPEFNVGGSGGGGGGGGGGAAAAAAAAAYVLLLKLVEICTERGWHW